MSTHKSPDKIVLNSGKTAVVVCTVIQCYLGRTTCGFGAANSSDHIASSLNGRLFTGAVFGFLYVLCSPPFHYQMFRISLNLRDEMKNFQYMKFLGTFFLKAN